MKAVIKMGEMEHEGKLTLDCYYTDLHWWKFEFSYNEVYKFGTLNAEQCGTREEAMKRNAKLSKALIPNKIIQLVQIMHMFRPLCRKLIKVVIIPKEPK